MIQTLEDIMRLVDTLDSYLRKSGCEFDERGFPIIPRSCYLSEIPDDVVTYKDRKSTLVKDISRAALCFFCGDERIYPRFERVFNEIDEYRKYMGVVGPDLTVTEDMDVEWQREIMLLNQLFLAVLATNGIKVIQNIRCGSNETLDCFKSIPPGIMCASGTLGCNPIQNPYDLRYLEKVFSVRPSYILIYGKRDPIMENQLETAGLPFKVYRDSHTRHKTRTRLKAQKWRTPS